MIDIAQRLAKLWNFQPTEELPGGHCSYVYATFDKVFKVPFQGEEMTSGYWAMMNFFDDGAPKIYESDPETGSMLMERAIPGTKLHQSSIEVSEQMAIWAALAHTFKSIVCDKLMPMEEYAGRKDPLVSHLLDTTDKVVTLHGDLHHENILKHGSGWMCIDAKGLLGDPAIEGAAFVCNPIPDCGAFTADQFSATIHEVAKELNVKSFRVWGWSVARMREFGSSPGDPWHHCLQMLYQIANVFNAERWILPLRSID